MRLGSQIHTIPMCCRQDVKFLQNAHLSMNYLITYAQPIMFSLFVLQWAITEGVVSDRSTWTSRQDHTTTRLRRGNDPGACPPTPKTTYFVISVVNKIRSPPNQNCVVYHAYAVRSSLTLNKPCSIICSSSSSGHGSSVSHFLLHPAPPQWVFPLNAGKWHVQTAQVLNSQLPVMSIPAISSSNTTDFLGIKHPNSKTNRQKVSFFFPSAGPFWHWNVL